MERLCARRGELLHELYAVDQQIGELHGETLRRCAICDDPIAPERLKAQPQSKTCSKPECLREHGLRRMRVNAVAQRKRKALQGQSGVRRSDSQELTQRIQGAAT